MLFLIIVIWVLCGVILIRIFLDIGSFFGGIGSGDWYVIVGQQMIGMQQWQFYYVGVVVGKVFDLVFGFILDGVGVGFVQWFVGGDIGGDVGGIDWGEGYFGNDQFIVQVVGVDYYYRGYYLVGVFGQLCQYCLCVGGIDWFVEDFVVQYDFGI